jgi:hypothetical protein
MGMHVSITPPRLNMARGSGDARAPQQQRPRLSRGRWKSGCSEGFLCMSSLGACCEV